MSCAKLIGGPFDGAWGNLTISGKPRLWVRADPASPGRFGLFIRLRPGLGAVPYDLAESGDVDRYVFDGVSTDAPVRDLEVCA